MPCAEESFPLFSVTDVYEASLLEITILRENFKVNVKTHLT